MTDNMEIGMRIKSRREELGLTLEDIARSVGVARSTIQRYEKGSIDSPKIPVLDAIAKVLKVNPAWLSCKSDDKISLSIIGEPYDLITRIPVLGRVSAGLPLYAEEHIEGYTYTDLNHKNEYFGLIVHGDSMTAARICDGDVIIVKRQDIVDDGKIAVVLVGDDEATVKRFYKKGSKVTLMPHSYNPEHKPQVYSLRETKIKILGEVVKVEISL